MACGNIFKALSIPPLDLCNKHAKAQLRVSLLTPLGNPLNIGLQVEGQHRRGCAGVRLAGQGAGLPRPGGRGHHELLAAAGRLQGDYNLSDETVFKIYKYVQ